MYLISSSLTEELINSLKDGDTYNACLENLKQKQVFGEELESDRMVMKPWQNQN